MKGLQVTGIWGIKFYDFPHYEWDDDSISTFESKVGVFPTSVGIVANISGKILGYDEALGFIKSLLGSGNDFIQDDGEEIWSYGELLSNIPKNGRYFLNHKRSLIFSSQKGSLYLKSASRKP